MDRQFSVFISLLLFVSLFYPFGVMAQENVEEIVVPTGFCSIDSSLNVVGLDYDQSTALQGVVTQDVATSAEEYRKQAALEELGVDTQGDRAKLADQYNFYFMGADGTVFYYEVLDDLMKPDNGFLIGSEITGRIEYGGHLRENLAMCGKTPANVSGNVCSAKGDVDKRDEYIEELEKVQTKADIMSLFVSLETIGELAPSDVLDLGQSRIRMTEFTTSLATSGPGSSVFVLPQALVMYTAAMKKLDMVDLVVGVIGMGAAFRSSRKIAQNLDPNRKGIWQSLKNVFGGKSTGEAYQSGMYLDDLTHINTRTDDMIRFLDDVDPDDAKAIRGMGDELFQYGDDGIKKSDALTDSLTASRNEVTLKLNNDFTDFKGALGDTLEGFTEAELDAIKGMDNVDDLFNNPQLTAKLKDSDVITEGFSSSIDEYSKLSNQLDSASNVKKEFSTFREAGLRMKASGSADELAGAQSELLKFKEGNAQVGSSFSIAGEKVSAKQYYDDRATLSREWSNLPADARPPFATYADLNGFKEVDATKLMSTDDLGKLAKESLDANDEAFDLMDSFRHSRLGNSLEDMTKQIKKGEWGAALFPSSKQFGTGAKGVTVATASAVLNRLALSIYTSTGTLAVMVARGFHAVNDLFFRQGFFELTGAGLTLSYSKDEIGEYYRDDSVIVLLAQNSLVKGLLSAYQGGELGGMLFGLMGSVSSNFEPIMSKANVLGDVLVFGGIMYPPEGGVIQVTTENPTGTTHIEQKSGYYLMHIREWDDHVFSAVEDVRTMEKKGDAGTLVTAMGLWTNKIDLYGHMYESENDLPAGVFTQFDPFIKKLGSWGVFSNLLIASSTYSVFFTRGAAGALGLGAATIGAPLGIFVTTKSLLFAGEEFMTAEYTDMDALSKCVRGVDAEVAEDVEGYEFAEATGEALGLTSASPYCNERKPCASTLSHCFNAEGAGSTGMVGTTIADIALASIAPSLGAAVVAADVALAIYKIKLREECLRDLATCQEHTFTIIGAAQYSDPAVIAEQQQSEQLKAVPGLDQLPVADFLDASGLGNVANPLGEMGQQQLNVHTEGYNASGRIAFSEVYYTHLQDVSIQWVEGNLPINLCSLDEDGNPEDENCLSIQGENVMLGGKTIVTDELVPFKWMDTELPALVIPNTAVTVDIGLDCHLFTVDKTGTKLSLNPDVITKFEGGGFEEITRMMGTLRVINTDSGSIYPSVDYNGDFRLEHDKPDGSFAYSEEGVAVTANAVTLFNNDELGFESAVFTGGSIIKKGDKIYVLPKYFMPEMSGRQWLEHTQGAPLQSVTGEQLEVLDADGNVLGIDASLASIPGGEKLGTLTRLDAWKDYNGDGEIQDEEEAGWRFFTDENNESKFELWYNGEKELYDADQVEVDEETGNIMVYEKGQPHVEANLLREIETKVDSLGRTLLTIKDGEGNLLLEEALVTYLKGTGGAIRYDPDNNNYIFVNGQPVELNNDFKLNGFNPITGRTDPPLLQPSSVRSQVKEYDEGEFEPPAVPLHDEGFGLIVYVLALFAGVYLVYRKT